MKVFEFIERVNVDAEVPDDLFWLLFNELSKVSTADEPEISRLVATKLIDFFVPDSEQMLYLSLAPQLPLLYDVRLQTKPYDHGVIEKNGSHYLNFDVIYKILAESSIEGQPLTILAADTVIAPLVRHFFAGRYDLPRGSRLVVVTDRLALPPSTKECERIFGIPPIISFYRPRGMVSYCCRTTDRGFQLPVWVKAFEKNDNLDFVDLASFSARGMIHSTNVGFVEGLFIRV